MLHKSFLFICLFIFISLAAFSQQTSSLKGKLTDSSTGKGIPDVQIFVQSCNKSSLTDRNGEFTMQRMQPGSCILYFTHLGYEDDSLYVELKAGQELYISREMQVRSRQLDEVEVKAHPLMQEPYRVEYIQRSQIQQSAQGDIGELLREEPNMGGIRKGGGNIDPVIRGFKFSQLNVVIDGATKIEGGCPNRMDPAVSHVDAGDISNIEIIKGPFALRYGPNFGGVINLQTLQPRPSEKFSAGVEASKGWESNWDGNKEYLAVNGGN